VIPPAVRETRPATPEEPRAPIPAGNVTAVEFPTFDLRGELRKIKAPTLVVVGDDDFICGPACADAIVRELPHARLVTIADSGHFVYIEQPEAFRAALTGFLL